MSDSTPGGQIAAPPGGRLLALAKRGVEHLLWGRVAVQRRLEARTKGARPVPTTTTAAAPARISGWDDRRRTGARDVSILPRAQPTPRRHVSPASRSR